MSHLRYLILYTSLIPFRLACFCLGTRVMVSKESQLGVAGAAKETSHD